MVLTKTPFRVSFFGGGTDYPVWYEENEGAVISTTINKYCYIMCRYLPPFFKHKSRIVWSKTELVQNIDEIQHPSVRETLRFLNINKGVEIHHHGDLPAMAGLGSSSSFTVGLLNALHSLEGKNATKRQLALDAINIEQNLIKENVGSQDQTAAAFGGLNLIKFGDAHKINVQPIALKKEIIDSLQDHLVLFFTGLARNASEVAAEQIKKTPHKGSELKAMRQMVGEAINTLQSNRLDDFGRLLHETWQIKRALSSKITNSFIDEIYESGLKAGALGGKLLGAGGGGFILFFVKPELKQNVIDKLKNLLHVSFRFDNLGSKIIYYDS
jgi:D-glycero-alpha-D-manno-heptose-7-phosphate kinase